MQRLPIYLTRSIAWLAVASCLPAQNRSQQIDRSLRDLGAPASGAAIDALVDLATADRDGMRDVLAAVSGLLTPPLPDPAGPHNALAAGLRLLARLAPHGDARLNGPADRLIEYWDALPSGLRVAAAEALAAMAPYAGQDESIELYSREERDEFRVREDWIAANLRYRARAEVALPQSLDAALRLLRSNRLYVRCVAAEVLGRLGDADAVAPLLAALRRPESPRGWDQFTINGILIPLDDEFRLRAAEAVVRLAPVERRTALAHGVLARQHPSLAQRRAALMALSTLAIDALPALDELLALAQDPHDPLAEEALVVLGMLGADAVAALPRLDAIAASDDGRARRARQLATQLRRQVPDAPAARPAAPTELERHLAHLTDPDTRDAACAALAGSGAEALPAIDALVDLIRPSTPADATVIRTLADVGRHADEAQRQRLAQIVLQHRSTVLLTSRFQYHAFRPPTQADHEAHARLTLGVPGWDGALAALDHENPYLRCAAARRIHALAAAETAAPGESARAAIQPLAAALAADHPASFPLRIDRFRLKIDARQTRAIRAAAREALLALADSENDAIATAARAAIASAEKR